MAAGATTVCRCVLSQNSGGMVREGMGHTDGDPGVPGKVGGNVRSWKVLEGWMTMTDHLGRYMHEHTWDLD